MNWIIGGLIALALAAGGWYYVSMSGEDAMMKQDEAMMEKQEDAMMKKEGEAMEEKSDTMMKQDGDAMMEKDTSAMEKDSMMAKGSYQSYSADKIALAKDGKVVLFFRASWCPTCKALDADIRSHLSQIPEGVTILDTNYDTETALKQKYGVTYQHTLVQVDASGNQVAKWSGGLALTDLIGKVQ